MNKDNVPKRFGGSKEVIDHNHDIVPTLRMFGGLMMGIAADEIEILRANLAKLEAASIPITPTLMVFDPKDGMREVYPSEARQYREWHGMVAWLYNPFTGDARSPQDIGTDPFGLLIVAPAKAPAEGHHV